MTRARRALLRAEHGYREALSLRDVMALRRAEHELLMAQGRVRRQDANSRGGRS